MIRVPCRRLASSLMNKMFNSLLVSQLSGVNGAPVTTLVRSTILMREWTDDERPQ